MCVSLPTPLKIATLILELVLRFDLNQNDCTIVLVAPDDDTNLEHECCYVIETSKSERKKYLKNEIFKINSHCFLQSKYSKQKGVVQDADNPSRHSFRSES